MKFGAVGFDPLMAGAHVPVFGFEVGDDHVVPGFPVLGKDVAVGVENHSVAGADFAVVGPDPVAENEK